MSNYYEISQDLQDRLNLLIEGVRYPRDEEEECFYLGFTFAELEMTPIEALTSTNEFPNGYDARELFLFIFGYSIGFGMAQKRRVIGEYAC